MAWEGSAPDGLDKRESLGTWRGLPLLAVKCTSGFVNEDEGVDGIDEGLSWIGVGGDGSPVW